VQDPFSPGTYYKAGTPILNSPNASPIAKQILSFFADLPPCQMLPARGHQRLHRLDSNDCPTNAPFTDMPTRATFDSISSRATKVVFLKVSDRKETGINSPRCPAARWANQRRIKILDQQIALGYTRLMGTNKVLDARLGLSATRAGKFTLSIGDNAIVIPGLPPPVVAGGLPSTSVSALYRFWTPEH